MSSYWPYLLLFPFHFQYIQIFYGIRHLHGSAIMHYVRGEPRTGSIHEWELNQSYNILCKVT